MVVIPRTSIVKMKTEKDLFNKMKIKNYPTSLPSYVVINI